MARFSEHLFVLEPNSFLCLSYLQVNVGPIRTKILTEAKSEKRTFRLDLFIFLVDRNLVQ